MHSLDRRSFLGTSLGGLAALAAGGSLLAADSGKKPPAIKSPAKPDALFLTWQRDPTTTMTIQWVGPELKDKPQPLQFAPREKDAAWKPANVEVRSYPKEGWRVFRTELTGLKPGAEYQFRLAGGGEYRFRTMPAKATDEFQFISGGDCGVNEHVVNNNILAARQDPMFALIGGDVAYDNGTQEETHLAFLRNYSQHMVDSAGRLIPMVACLGNHEVRGGYNGKREDAALYFSLFDGLYPERSYATLDFGDYLSLVLLDTGHVAPIEGEQTDWLAKELAARADHPHVFAVNHVPAYPSYRVYESAPTKTGTGEGNRKHWVPLFERHNVDIVLEHHDHTFKRTHPLIDSAPDKNGVLYLGDGSWGKLRAPKDPEDRPYLATASQAYHMSLHRLEGEQRFHLALAEGGRVIDVCMTRKRARS